ncbi:50S ribosomal protein L5 [Patescibacteria group bacterium]|nr:50S ribosomal protein L5 [Patescibacteria group bacterium]
MNNLRKKYQNKIVPLLKKELGVNNDLAVPRLKTIVINTGIGQEQGQKEALESMADQLAVITGQRPVMTRAKKSIAGFKLRQGDPIGLKVTLHGRKMYDFFEKLVTIALPRVKDFQGTKINAFDGRGNYSIGLTEQLIFPEIDYDKIDRTRGLQVVIITTASDDDQARRLLKLLGIPFEKEKV